MKRRTFIQRGSIGLGAILAGGGGADRLLEREGGKRRVYGIPDSVKRRTPLEHNLARYSLAQSDLPPEAWQDVVALGLLAQDVFENPKVAEAFSRNPRAYLKSVGMEDVDLDPATAEVKLALALGDPEIRDAVERVDPKAFIEAAERKGLLRIPEPSQLATRLSEQINALQTQLGPGPSPESCTVYAVCLAVVVLGVWIYVGAVQDVVVAVAGVALVSLYASVVAWVSAWGGEHHKRSMIWEVGQAPSFRLAGVLGGEAFAGEVAGSFIDSHVEKVAAAVEGLPFYRDNTTLEPARLRDLIKTQMLRQLSGHAVIDAAPIQ